MDGPLDITIIGNSKKSVEDIVTAIKNSIIPIKICSFPSEDSFFINHSQVSADIVLFILLSAKSDWEFILNKIKDGEQQSFVIFFVPGEPRRDLSMKMIGSGAYDVLYQKSLNDFPVLLQRIVRDIDHRKFLGFLSLDKKISDHILDNSRSMLTIINRNYTYEKANTRFCDAHQIDKDFIVGRSLSEIWGHDNFENNIRRNIDSCFSGETVHYEASFHTPAQGKRYFEVSFRPLTTGNDQITHLLAETFDITDFKLTRKAYEEIEKEYKKLETNIPIGYARCDTSGRVLHVNRTFLRIMEYDEEKELINVNLEKIYADGNLFRTHLEQILIESSKILSRVLLLSGKGKEIPCRITAFLVPCENENDKPSYIDFSFEDNTRELILENRLIQAQKLETIGSLAGGIAHDFNNILATIFGYSELILDDVPVASPVTEKIGKIITAIAKARSLTNQILTFSRQVEQEKIYVSVWKVLEETIDFVKAGVPDNIQIIDNVKRNKAFVYADPTQLFRVFLNLMTNSVQAMEEKEGRLIIDLNIVEGKLIKNELSKDIVADEYALISLKDNGIGMDASVMNRIFEPFFTTRDVGKGTGLGLSVVHGIISEIEGEILVSSTKNKGTAFYVYIPISKYSPKKNKMILGAKEILFVSVNNHESRILSLALENSGFKLIFTSDYKRLGKLFKAEKQLPDLIIFMDDSADSDMENIISALLNEKLNIPVIIITDYEHCLLDEKLVNSGIIKQRLIKPVSLKEVRNAILFSLKR
jgi:PAS domain S-box-containing protein